MRNATIVVLGLLSIAGALPAMAQTDPGDMPGSVLLTGEGPALRVGPPEAHHYAGLLANGGGAFGIVIADDGAFLAFTCGMRPEAGAWFSGDWYQGRLGEERATSPDGDRLELERDASGRLHGRLTSADGGPRLAIEAEPAAPGDGLYRRDDADGILGAVALPGNTVCAVKRTMDGHFLPAGTVPY